MIHKFFDELIEAVEDTPNDLLTRGRAITYNGEVCAIGAYAYAKDPQFREVTDALRAGDQSRTPLSVDTIPYELLDKVSKTLGIEDLAVEVFHANDDALLSNPLNTKTAIVKALRKLQEKLIIQEVIKTVQETPAEFLTHGEPVTNNRG